MRRLNILAGRHNIQQQMLFMPLEVDNKQNVARSTKFNQINCDKKSHMRVLFEINGKIVEEISL